MSDDSRNLPLEKDFIHNRRITPEERRNAGSKGIWSIRPNPISAGGPQEVTLEYTAGQEGIKTGGGIKLEIPQVWFQPQLSEPCAESYVGIHCPEGLKITTSLTRDEVWEYYLTITLEDGELGPGDKITVLLGDQRAGSPGAMVQRFVQKGEFESGINRLNVFVDSNGDDVFDYVSADKPLNVVGNCTAFLDVTAPSFVEKGKPFDVKIVAKDLYRNIGHPFFAGEVAISSSPDEEAAERAASFSAGDRGIMNLPGLVLDKRGVHTLSVCSLEHKISGGSNPIICVPRLPELNLYWGEIHTHTALSDGRGNPMEAYEYAREVANLDFAALADHAHFDFTDEAWEITKKAAKQYNDPGRFVTLPGYEWTRSWDHRNVYYLDDDPPLFRDDDPKSDVPQKLWKCLEGRQAIVIPHHNLFCGAWEDSNPEFERAVEVYSMWGLSEYKGNPLWTLKSDREGISVREMLATGVKLGFVAGQDNHDARPGATASESCSLNLRYRGGIMAVWAKDLTRESIFEAIWHRRTYGTTGERIVLDFKVNGHWMGEEVELSSHPHIEVSFAGTDVVKSIEVVRNGETIHTCFPASSHDTMEYVDESVPPGESYYYVKVTQADGNMAWASPVFVRMAGKAGTS